MPESQVPRQPRLPWQLSRARAQAPESLFWGPGAARSPHEHTRPCCLAPALFSSPAKADGGKEQLTYESGEDEEEEEEDFKPSDGSENEMETEMLDYV